MKALDEQQNKRLKRTLKQFSVILAFGIAYFIFVKIVGFGIPCIFHVITGLHCPGCGISRMFIALASLDFKSAFHSNALILCTLPVSLFYIARHYYFYIKTGKPKYTKLETVLLVIALVLLIIFGILRNFPSFSFLAP